MNLKYFVVFTACLPFQNIVTAPKKINPQEPRQGLFSIQECVTLTCWLAAGFSAKMINDSLAQINQPTPPSSKKMQ